MIAAFTVIFCFDQIVAIFALSTLIICDTFAAFFGIKFGKHKIYENKSLEGLCGFLLGSIFIYLFCIFIDLDIKFVPFLIASILTAIIELFAKKLFFDDNILIPIFFAICYISVS